MAVGTDPLRRDSIAIVSRDTGDRYQGASDNSALRLARALGNVQPALNDTLQAVAQGQKDKQEAAAKAAALEASGAPLADAVRAGTIKATQNPWFISAYEAEAGAIRGQDALSKLQTDSASWQERNDPAAFAKRWHTEVGNLAKQFDYSPDAFKGFDAAQAQASQQALATNQSYNSARITAERTQNLSALAADAVQKEVQARGGHISGSQMAMALEPAKQQWLLTGGSQEDWNKLVISAVTTASYSLRSPSLLDALKDPALLNGPSEGDTSSYGDGVDADTHTLPTPLQPAPAATPQEGNPPLVSTAVGQRLQPPAMGRTVAGGTYAAHLARGSHGVDVAVPVGTKVTSPISGTAKVGHDDRSGLFVAVKGDDGKLYTSFSHLSLAGVQNGQRITAGEVVGRSGQSGDAHGPHIHWRLKVDGKDVDPTVYRVTDTQPAQQLAPAVAEGAAAPELTPPGPPPVATVMGPSLYDMSGVADQVESDRYRIRAAVNSEAGDRLQAMTNERKLQGLAATDKLYATFGTSLLTGNVDTQTIIKSLSADYPPQVIAEAINNVRGAVGDSAALGSARLSLNDSDPTKAKQLFDLATEGRTKGWSQDYEDRVGNMVINGDISASEGTTMVEGAIGKTEHDASEARTQANYDSSHGGKPGATIRKASEIGKGIDAYAAQAIVNTNRILGASGSVPPQEATYLKSRLRNVVLSYLADHPQDYAGAEQTARDWVASYLRTFMARRQHPTATKPPQQSAAGGNPRR